MDMIGTDLHLLNRDVILLRNSKSSRTRCCISPCNTSRRYLGDQTKW